MRSRTGGSDGSSRSKSRKGLRSGEQLSYNRDDAYRTDVASSTVTTDAVAGRGGGRIRRKRFFRRDPRVIGRQSRRIVRRDRFMGKEMFEIEGTGRWTTGKYDEKWFDSWSKQSAGVLRVRETISSTFEHRWCDQCRPEVREALGAGCRILAQTSLQLRHGRFSSFRSKTACVNSWKYSRQKS